MICVHGVLMPSALYVQATSQAGREKSSHMDEKHVRIITNLIEMRNGGSSSGGSGSNSDGGTSHRDLSHKSYTKLYIRFIYWKHLSLL